jgi:RNA polymerase sigma factor (sigma-70 family)
MASTTASISTAFDDHKLARRAVAGDGDAFALLYDRHERRVFGFCLRMLGSEDAAAEATQETFMRLLRRLPALQGRELNFVAYALAAARNACYDAIEARRRVEPVGEHLERLEPRDGEPGELALDPERAAMLDATRERVRAANDRLPERQREVLALRELEQLSYEQIGDLIGLNGNAVAQLISRARIKLRDLLRGDALESLLADSPACRRALPLLARMQDEQAADTEELSWLLDHLDDCERCRLGRAAMEEAGASYRALGPIVVVAWLRQATIARAAQMVGTDWSEVASAATNGDGAGGARGRDRAGDAKAGARGGGASGGSGAGGARGGTGAGAGLGSAPAARAMAHGSAGARRALGSRRVRRLAGLALLCAILLASLAASIAPERRVLLRQAAPVPLAAPRARASARVDAHRHARGGARRRRARHASRSTALALAGGAAVAPVQTSAPTPAVGVARPPAGRRRSRKRAVAHTSPSAPPPSATPPPTPTTSTQPSTATTPAPGPSSESSAGGSGTASTPAQPTSGSTGSGASGSSGSSGSGSGSSGSGGGSSGSGTGSSGSGGGTESGSHGCTLAIAC